MQLSPTVIKFIALSKSSKSNSIKFFTDSHKVLKILVITLNQP